MRTKMKEKTTTEIRNYNYLINQNGKELHVTLLLNDCQRVLLTAL